jgi:hypothetical protein
MVSQTTTQKEVPKTDEPQQEEIYYDSVKKRWVLRGKIYDDDDGNKAPVNKEEKKVVIPPKPIVKPPRLNNPITPKVEQVVEDKPKDAEPQGAKINNPFAVNKPPVKKDNIQKPNKPSLANRYSSIVDS